MTARTWTSAVVLGIGLALPAVSGAALAASHREAPLIALDPAADNTDTYAFVSYDEVNLARSPDDQRVTFIMNVNPGQDPGDGPNYFNFDDNVTYRFNIDNDADGVDDVIYEVKFETENRPIGGSLSFPLAYVGSPNLAAAGLGGITALDGTGSEGLTLRQTYSVTRIEGNSKTKLFDDQLLVAVPSNVGPATMPDYEGLAAQGIYEDSGMRVFAGQRAETFYIDLGAIFDTVNTRRFPPILDPTEDGNDAANPFGMNRFSGFNISTIALEVPIRDVTVDGLSAVETGQPQIGIYASTSRHMIEKQLADGTTQGEGPLRQRSRLANALVDELLIDTPFKDQWNAAEPEEEADFEDFYVNPSLEVALRLLLGVEAPAKPRADLLQLFNKYAEQPVQITQDSDSGEIIDVTCGSPCSELLRVDLSVPATPAAAQRRMTVFADVPDVAGFPNGRRPNDDVTDIALRVVGAPILADIGAAGAALGDGVNFLEDAPGIGTADGLVYGQDEGALLDVTDHGIAAEFPFLPTPHDGRNHQHIDCDEEGANACDEAS